MWVYAVAEGALEAVFGVGNGPLGEVFPVRLLNERRLGVAPRRGNPTAGGQFLILVAAFFRKSSMS